MALLDPAMGHLLRRAGFGASAEEVPAWNALSVSAAIDKLVDYESSPGDVDENIAAPGYLGVTARGPFEPNTRISDAAQRWIFRMVHSERPLQEKMALFWHNHFATGFSKIAGQLRPRAASRALAAKPSEDADGVKGQLELFREHALGNFRDLLLAVSEDPAMVAWLDGDTNFKALPQENYARELMELFTIGVNHYTEDDVYAGARVFTGWNLQRNGRRTDSTDSVYSTFRYRSEQHDTDKKTFSFAIYPDGGNTIPARSASEGFQDGVDLVNAVANHPETGAFLARKLYAYFVNETSVPDDGLIQQLSDAYYSSGFNMREVVRQLLRSSQFQDPANYWARYSWPAEFVARLIKEVGWAGFSARAVLSPLSNMGQRLFEPPDVSGWSLGPSWFSTGTMLARMNFAATLARNQRFAIQQASIGSAATPQSFLAYFTDRMSTPPFDTTATDGLLAYITATSPQGSADGEPWSGSGGQVAVKGAGLVHLIGASSEYQFV